MKKKKTLFFIYNLNELQETSFRTELFPLFSAIHMTCKQTLYLSKTNKKTK